MKNQNQGRPETIQLNKNEPHSSGFMPSVVTQSSYPFLSAMHFLLKAGILALYLIVPLFTKSLNMLMFVIILAAIDFWIVKNLSGRLLVGLRWWIDFDEKGEEEWKFECKVDEKNVAPANGKIFWWTLVLFSVIWVLLSVINILKLSFTHIAICVFCAAMLVFNLHSYYKCSKIQEENVNRLVTQYGAEAAMKYMGGSIITKFA